MDKHHGFFIRYVSGDLEPDEAAGLHHWLVMNWFESPGRLDPEELEYAEDYIIERFNNQTLEEKYHSVFKNRMMADPELDAKVKLYRNLDTGLSRKYRRDLMEEQLKDQRTDPEDELLRNILKDLIASSEPPARRFNRWIIAAVSMAAFFTIVIAGWYLFRIESSDDRYVTREEPKQEIMHDTFEQSRKTNALNVEQLREALPRFFDPVRVFDVMVLRSAERSIPEENYIRASELYNEEKYDQAARLLERLDRDRSFSDQDSIASLRYYLGHCYLNSGMATGDSVGLLKAVRTFKLIGRDSQYYYDARWYQSIALLKAGRIGEARSLLDKLLSNNYFRSGKVRALRNLLK